MDGWDEDSYEFMEEEGWYNDETEAWLYGPLEIVRIDEPEQKMIDQPEPGTAPHRPTELAPGVGTPLTGKNKSWPF